LLPGRPRFLKTPEALRPADAAAVPGTYAVAFKSPPRALARGHWAQYGHGTPEPVGLVGSEDFPDAFAPPAVAGVTGSGAIAERRCWRCARHAAWRCTLEQGRDERVCVVGADRDAAVALPCRLGQFSRVSTARRMPVPPSRVPCTPALPPDPPACDRAGIRIAGRDVVSLLGFSP
jgi:hypothetical protein